MRKALPLVSLAALLLATPVLAQSNLEKLGAFQQTGVTEAPVGPLTVVADHQRAAAHKEWQEERQNVRACQK